MSPYTLIYEDDQRSRMSPYILIYKDDQRSPDLALLENMVWYMGHPLIKPWGLKEPSLRSISDMDLDP